MIYIGNRSSNVPRLNRFLFLYIHFSLKLETKKRIKFKTRNYAFCVANKLNQGNILSNMQIILSKKTLLKLK